MPNIGRTTIEATGSPQDLVALAAHVRGTARGSSAFTLSGLMRPDPAPDHAVRWAELSATDGMVSLSVDITYDRDALGVAARIAERFPTLRIDASFVAKCDESAFDALRFAGGRLAYEAHFDDGHRQLGCRPACGMRVSQVGGRDDNVRRSQLRRLPLPG